MSAEMKTSWAQHCDYKGINDDWKPIRIKSFDVDLEWVEDVKICPCPQCGIRSAQPNLNPT